MNINSINYGNQAQALKSASININSNKDDDVAKTAASALSDCMVSGLGTTTNTENTAHSAKALMQEAEDVLEQLKQSAQDAKGSLKALTKKLSGADCVQLDKDGYGLNDTDTDEMVTVVERIKIMLATYCEDYEPVGQPVDMDAVKEVVGSSAAAGRVADKLSGYDVALTKENIEDTAAAIGEYKNIGDITDSAKL